MIGIHITEKARNTRVENCEFINCGIKDEGKGSSVKETKFIKTVHLARTWFQKWWGQIIIGVVVVLVGGIALFVLGIN